MAIQYATRSLDITVLTVWFAGPSISVQQSKQTHPLQLPVISFFQVVYFVLHCSILTYSRLIPSAPRQSSVTSCVYKWFYLNNLSSILQMCCLASEEVVHARNVIAFFVWGWPSRFCDWSGSPWWATSWRGTLWPYRARKVGVPRGSLFPSWLCLSDISRVVWAWPDPLPTRLKRVGKMYRPYGGRS